MKTKHKALPAIFAATLVAALPVHAAILVDFDVSTDYTTDFTEINTTSDSFTWSSSTGVGGTSGRVDVTQGATTDSTALYNQSSFNLSDGSPQTISLFFLIPPTIGGDALITAAQVGFSEDLTQAFLSGGGQDYVSARVRSTTTGTNYTLEGTYANNGAAANVNLTSAFTLTASTWYKLSATFTDTGSGFTYSALVEDYGATGSTLVGAVSGASITSQAMNQTSLSDGSDVTAYAGFRANGNPNNKVLAVDNFGVVPEPTTNILMLCGLGLIIGSRRILRRGVGQGR